MAIQAGVGKSIAADAEGAGREAARLACARFEGRAPDFVLVFGTSGYDQEMLLRGVRSVTGAARVSGCSGEGVIAGADSDERDRAVAVCAFRSETIRFRPFLASGYHADPAACARTLADFVRNVRDETPRALLLFPDGLLGNCSRLLETLESELPPGIPVLGGTAGDAMIFERTWQYLDGTAETDSVAAVLVTGNVEVRFQVSHGCQTLGLDRVVTEADGGWLRTIDNRPAWSVFREFLDGDPEDLNAEGIAHLSLAEELRRDGSKIIHTPLQLDRETGALFFPGGGIAAGTRVRIARRDPDSIRESARICAQTLTGTNPEVKPAFVLQFDCAGRGRLMFGPCAADEIVRPLQSILGPAVPWIGFHTFGEIAPIEGRSRYHNYTVALCAFHERDPDS